MRPKKSSNDQNIRRDSSSSSISEGEDASGSESKTGESNGKKKPKASSRPERLPLPLPPSTSNLPSTNPMLSASSHESPSATPRSDPSTHRDTSVKKEAKKKAEKEKDKKSEKSTFMKGLGKLFGSASATSAKHTESPEKTKTFSMEDILHLIHADIEALKKQLEGGVLNRMPPKAQAELVCDASNGKPERLRLLIEHGAVLNEFDRNGEYPLRAACTSGESACLKILLDSGADLPQNHQQQVDLLLRLMKSLYKCSKSKPKLLLTETHAPGIGALVARCKNLDVIGTNPAGHTPLSLACREKDIPMISLLIKNGASPHFQTQNGFTALTYACSDTSGARTLVDMINAMLKAKAKLVDKPDGTGTTALMAIAKKYDAHYQIIAWKRYQYSRAEFATEGAKLLLNAGAKPDQTDADGNSVLYHALYNLNAPLARLLISSGAKLKSLSQEQQSQIKLQMKAWAEYGDMWEDNWFKDQMGSL